MYLRDNKTGKVFKSKVQPAGAREISKEVYDADIKHQEEYAPIASTIKPIYAKVPTTVFEAFNKRCRAEGVSIGDAFALIVTQYAHGAMLTKVSKKATEAFRYVDEVKKNNG